MMKRYGIYANVHGGTETDIEDDGEWVRYEDVAELSAQLESAEEALRSSFRAAELSLFVIRKQNVMPNSSWESGFNRDMESARAHMEKYHGR